MSLIATSLLDNDWYNFKMSRTFWKLNMHNISVNFRFKCISEVDLLKMISIDELSHQLTHLFKLQFSYRELAYLSKYFEEEYINYLSLTSPKDVNMHLYLTHKGFGFTYNGPIGRSIFYETPSLYIINNLYIQGVKKYLKSEDDKVIENGINNIRTVNSYGAKIIEFGTRRRSSFSQQKEIIKYASALPCYQGTSNVLLSWENETTPCGTQAHLWFMIYAAIAYSQFTDKCIDFSKLNTRQLADKKEYMIESQRRAVDDWIKYNPNSVLLTDTYGTDIFLNKIMSLERLSKISGLRQDSGDAVYRTNQLFKYYESHNVNKTVMPSDGLTPTIIKVLQDIAEKKGKRLRYGYGTNLTFDGIVKPISIVIEPDCITYNKIQSNCIKLSDNPLKAVGEEHTISNYKTLFEYRETKEQEVVY